MAELTDAQIDAALERGRIANQTEARANGAHYDRDRQELVLELTSGVRVLVPVGLVQGLEAATSDQRAQVEILGSGSGLHWVELDVDLSVPGLLAAVIGTKSHMARLAGRSRSEAKTAAARENGMKGGRPKIPPGSAKTAAAATYAQSKSKDMMGARVASGAAKVVRDSKGSKDAETAVAKRGKSASRARSAFVARKKA